MPTTACFMGDQQRDPELKLGEDQGLAKVYVGHSRPVGEQAS
jgi:hypothetical protein